MKKRKLPLGDRNMIGARVTEARNNLDMKQTELLSKLQVAGVEISIPALSLLEGQKRPVSDLELFSMYQWIGFWVESKGLQRGRPLLLHSTHYL